MDPLQPYDPKAISRYRLLGRLGSGGMGVVYLARSPGGRLVAVKCVHRELAGDAEFRRRFARESAAAKSVGGFHTAPVVDADPDGDPPWLVTAYIPGLTLADAIVAAGGSLPAATVRALGAGLAEALGAIHVTGLVHRDLKPSNVLVNADGPRVIDFGIARGLDDTPLTRSRMAVGTPGFSSPEQLTGAPVGPAADVFCLGLVLCHAGGVPPFGRGNAEAMLYRIVHQEPVLDGIPDDMRDLVARCLTKDPAARPLPAALLDRWGTATTLTPEWLPAEVNATIAALVATVPASGGNPGGAGRFGGPGDSGDPEDTLLATIADGGFLRRRAGATSAIAVVGVAVAATGLYFGLKGGGGSPSSTGTTITGTTITGTSMSSAAFAQSMSTVNAQLAPDFDAVAKASSGNDTKTALTKLSTDAGNLAGRLPTDPPEALSAPTRQLSAALTSLSSPASATAGDVGSVVCTSASAVAEFTRSDGAGALRSAAGVLSAVDASYGEDVAGFLPAPIADQNRRLNNGQVLRRSSGPGSLIINDSGTDAVVVLTAVGSKTPVASIYVRANEKATLTDVSATTFDIYVASGMDWDSAAQKFSRQCSYSKTDSTWDFGTSNWSLNLTGQVNGNLSVSTLNQGDAPSP